MNKIYKEFYKNKVFTLDEATKIIKNYQVCRNTINQLSKQKLIKKIKAGLYYITPIDTPDFYPDPTHIASKLRDDAIISSTTALKIHKLQAPDEASGTLYIIAKHQAKRRLDKYTYRISKDLKGQFGILKTQYQASYGLIDLKVTDLERTIIECIRTRSIKAVDMINMLKNRQPQIDISKIITYLEKYNIGILYNKMGLILDTCAQYLKITPIDMDKIKKKLSKKIYYYKEPGLRLIRPRYGYNKDWNIMITEQLRDHINTIKPQQNTNI